jgi:hypothetical protein
MHVRALARAVLAATVVLVATAGTAHAGQRAPEPTVVLSTTNLTPGTPVSIIGKHWPSGSLLQASLCGNRALDGSANCVPDTAVTMTPGPDGSFEDALQVTIPPVPCPCVVLVTRLDANDLEVIPVEIVGAPVAPVELHAPPKLQNSLKAQVKVESSTTLASVLGGAADRTLVVTLHNDANVPVRGALMVSFWGKDTANHPIPTRLVTVPARGTVTVRVPFELDPLSIGGYDVKGVAGTNGNTVEFSSSTSQWPWGLVIVLVLVIWLVQSLFVRRSRRALLRREAAQAAAAAAAAGTAGAVVAGDGETISWKADEPVAAGEAVGGVEVPG